MGILFGIVHYISEFNNEINAEYVYIYNSVAYVGHARPLEPEPVARAAGPGTRPGRGLGPGPGQPWARSRCWARPM